MINILTICMSESYMCLQCLIRFFGAASLIDNIINKILRSIELIAIVVLLIQSIGAAQPQIIQGSIRIQLHSGSCIIDVT